MKKANKNFDCVAMKRSAQNQIREQVAGMSREEEIAYFREGAEAFEKRIEQARRELKERTASSSNR